MWLLFRLFTILLPFPTTPIPTTILLFCTGGCLDGILLLDDEDWLCLLLSLLYLSVDNTLGGLYMMDPFGFISLGNDKDEDN